MTLDELLGRVEAAGFEESDLDAVVHDLKAQEAQEINNAGLLAQLKYVLEAHGGDFQAVCALLGLQEEVG